MRGKGLGKTARIGGPAGWCAAATHCVSTLAIVAALSIGFSTRASAQATPLVEPSARVYRDLERMASLGLIDTLMVGVRPFSEREIVRRLTEAQHNLSRIVDGREWAEARIAAGLARYRRVGNRALDAASAEVALMDSPFRDSPRDANGELPAWINPLAAYRQGRPIVSGATESIETMHTAVIGSHVAVAFNPRTSAAAQSSAVGQSELTLQSGYIRTLIGDLSLEVGRNYAIMGQAPAGGLLLSTNAPALDMVRLANDGAWRVPGVSRIFGPFRGSLLVADLGTDQQLHPHTKLIAYHLTSMPHPRFELGVQVVDAMGGDGGQPATFSDRVLDAIPIVDAFRQSSDFQFSNKFAGMDFHWRMPHWRGFELYGEGNADDFDGRNLSRGFGADAGYLIGAAVACVASCGTMGLRAEYHKTGIRYYTHGDYPLSSQGLLLGDPLGPRAEGGYLSADMDLRGSMRLTVTTGFETRSGNFYRSATTGAHEEGFHFELVSTRPSEKRGRLLATWTYGEENRLATTVSAGVERAWNFQFAQGAERTNALLRVGVVARGQR